MSVLCEHDAICLAQTDAPISVALVRLFHCLQTTGKMHFSKSLISTLTILSPLSREDISLFFAASKSQSRGSNVSLRGDNFLNCSTINGC